MSAPSTSGLSVELLLRVIDVKHMVTLLYMRTCAQHGDHTQASFQLTTLILDIQVMVN